MEPEREQVEESGRDQTQRDVDEGGPDERPADVEWGTEPSPHEGEEGTDPAA